MSTLISETKSNRAETLGGVFLFCGLLAFHVWGASVGWKNLNLPGVEFRQTQTAISAFFIQQNHDFSLAYPTPVLGKPWSVPVEFPLYQWTVVSLSNATGLDLTKAGRVVSLACFYLTLPALYLLLAKSGLTWPRRLVALGFVLSCPLYIFYGRAFLMETMALMFAGWFLVGYLCVLEHRSPAWFVFACLSGAGAGLVKVTTFVAILIPALVWTLAWLWRQRRGEPGVGWKKLAIAATRALAVVLLPCAAAWWWLHFADAVKARNPAADFLTAGRLTDFIFGSGDTRFSAAIWREHFAIIFRNIASGWVLAATGLLALCFVRRRWNWILILTGCFFAVQILFPVLYALHEYYYIANAFLLLLAIGLTSAALLETNLPRFLSWGVILALQVGQAWGYLHVQYPVQLGASPGGTPITQALRITTDPDDVLIVAGEDWCANTPYYSQRRALMFRNGLERDPALLTTSLAQLKGEKVGALILAGAQRDNHELLDRVVRDFDIDPRPVFTCLESTVYFHRRLRFAAIALCKTVPDAGSVHLTPESIPDEHALIANEVDLSQLPVSYGQKFAGMFPIPFKYYASYGVDRQTVDGREMLFSHPETRLWFHSPAGHRVISIEVELAPGAYADSLPPGDRSDGVEVVVSLEGPGRVRKAIFNRWLNPRDQPSDRGLQKYSQEFELASGEDVVVEITPGPQHSSARDWAMLGRIEIK
jgi:hypothetical protein